MNDEVEIDMEELGMNGSMMEKKAEKALRKKRREIEKLKRLVGIDPWEDEDELNPGDAGERVLDFLKFMKDPMVKPVFKPSSYKKAVNALIDVATVFEELADSEDAKLLKKI